MNINELEELAKEATPGPWWIDSHGHAMISEVGKHRVVFTTDHRMGPAVRHESTGNLSHWPNDWDASYIAAANPSAISELIAAYREAVAVIKGSNCMCWSGCEICENWPTDEQALATAKRLGIDQL
jgi:hypothetical protein